MFSLINPVCSHYFAILYTVISSSPLSLHNRFACYSYNTNSFCIVPVLTKCPDRKEENMCFLFLDGCNNYTHRLKIFTFRNKI
jgi:hypothetical protein